MTQKLNKKSVLIAIPALNLLEYSKKLLATIKCSYRHFILLIDNGSTDGTTKFFRKYTKNEGVFFTQSDKNLGASGSWNYALQLGFNGLKCSDVVCLNNDILLLPGTLDRIISDLDIPGVGISSAKDVSGKVVNEKEFFTKKVKNQGWYQETPDFSCFGINIGCFSKVGFFDEAFYPAYFEDNDYHYRMKLAGVKAYCDYLNFYFHYGSRTKLADKRFEDYIKMQYVTNRDYYVAKWGGIPGEEKFNIPFEGNPPLKIEITKYEDYKDELLKLNR